MRNLKLTIEYDGTNFSGWQIQKDKRTVQEEIEKALAKILKQYKEQAKIDKELTPHTIRHSFAVHMLQNGAEIKTVQELLGHTDVASTLMYTHVADMKLRDEYLKAHPRV